MRVFYGLFLMLAACTSHAVRCDGPLQPVNPPAARIAPGAAASEVPVPAATAVPVHPPRSVR
jgi:hypothetical protein